MKKVADAVNHKFRMLPSKFVWSTPKGPLLLFRFPSPFGPVCKLVFDPFENLGFMLLQFLGWGFVWKVLLSRLGLFKAIFVTEKKPKLPKPILMRGRRSLTGRPQKGGIRFADKFEDEEEEEESSSEDTTEDSSLQEYVPHPHAQLLPPSAGPSNKSAVKEGSGKVQEEASKEAVSTEGVKEEGGTKEEEKVQKGKEGKRKKEKEGEKVKGEKVKDKKVKDGGKVKGGKVKGGEKVQGSEKVQGGEKVQEGKEGEKVRKRKKKPTSTSQNT